MRGSLADDPGPPGTTTRGAPLALPAEVAPPAHAMPLPVSVAPARVGAADAAVERSRGTRITTNPAQSGRIARIGW
jgi:hypothetical protein